MIFQLALIFKNCSLKHISDQKNYSLYINFFWLTMIKRKIIRKFNKVKEEKAIAN